MIPNWAVAAVFIVCVAYLVNEAVIAIKRAIGHQTEVTHRQLEAIYSLLFRMSGNTNDLAILAREARVKKEKPDPEWISYLLDKQADESEKDN